MELPYKNQVLSTAIKIYNQNDTELQHYDENGLIHDKDATIIFHNGDIYTGSVTHGIINTFSGKLCTSNHSIIYHGKLINNVIECTDIIATCEYTYSNGSKYIGQLKSGLRHGYGTYYNTVHHTKYIGQWYMGYRHGHGKCVYHCDRQNGVESFYQGEWLNNMRHGAGTIQYSTGDMYTGQWYHNMKHGMGCMQWVTNHELYNGEWKNDVIHGHGKYTYLQRSSLYPNVYCGQFMNGFRNSVGHFIYSDGSVYHGEYNMNMKHGIGKYIFNNGAIYDTGFSHDKPIDLTLYHTMKSKSMTQSINIELYIVPCVQYCVQQVAAHSTDISESDIQLAIKNETKSVESLLQQYNSQLHTLYQQYSTSSVWMTLHQFHQLLMDRSLVYNTTDIHHQSLHPHDLATIDRYLYSQQSIQPDSINTDINELHDQSINILYWQFVWCIVQLATNMYDTQYSLTQRLSLLMSHILTVEPLSHSSIDTTIQQQYAVIQCKYHHQLTALYDNHIDTDKSYTIDNTRITDRTASLSQLIDLLHYNQLIDNICTESHVYSTIQYALHSTTSITPTTSIELLYDEYIRILLYISLYHSHIYRMTHEIHHVIREQAKQLAAEQAAVIEQQRMQAELAAAEELKRLKKLGKRPSKNKRMDESIAVCVEPTVEWCDELLPVEACHDFAVVHNDMLCRIQNDEVNELQWGHTVIDAVIQKLLIASNVQKPQ